MLKIINKISDRNRENKYNIFINLFSPNANTKILDVGASELEYRQTSNYLEKKYPYPGNITVLGIDDYNEFCIRYPQVTVVKYDGEVFPFEDNKFDMCWCNAVIEHVGDRRKQEIFLNEIIRVSKCAFISTPNKHFIYEPHTKVLFLHFLPKNIFNIIVKLIGKPWAGGDYMHLLGERDIVNLLNKCNIDKYRIIKNKLLCFTIDFVIIINEPGLV